MQTTNKTHCKDSINALKILLEEAHTMAGTDKKATATIQKCQNEVKRLETIENGILSKFRLDGQVALVTGGAQGIGRAFCLALGEAGAKVAVADLDRSRAEIVAAELKGKGIESIAIKVDVSKKEDCEAMVDKVLCTWGSVDIGVNNAGIVFHSDSEETSEKEWDLTMGVNLDGVFFCCQAEAKHMLGKGRGKIINTASMSGSIVNRPQKQLAYNVSKAGVIHLTKTLGSEWADRGIQVNSISPGYIETPLSSTGHLLTMQDQWIKDTPMRRMGKVDDLTGALIYLASQLSNFTTGTDLVVDGGFSCW